MLKIVAKMHFKEGGDPAKFLEIAKEVVEKTNALDKGCISYEFCKSEQDPNGYAMFEQWESQEALASHMQSEHFTSLVPAMDAFCEGGPDLLVYEKLF